MNMNVIKDVSVRLVALFVSSALGIITGSSVIQAFTETSVPLWFQALQAGGAAVALVVYDLAKALNDGKLTQEEVDAAFGIDRSKHGDDAE
jgi:sensor domain CHASE-containing protein